MCFRLPQVFYRHILLDGLPFLCSTQGIGVTCHPKFDGLAPSVHDGFYRKMSPWGFSSISKLTVLKEKVLGRTFPPKLLIFRKKFLVSSWKAVVRAGLWFIFQKQMGKTIPKPERWTFLKWKEGWYMYFWAIIPVFFGKYLLAAIHSNALDRCGWVRDGL